MKKNFCTTVCSAIIFGFSLCLLPLSGSAFTDANKYVLQRLQSPERATAIGRMAQQDTSEPSPAAKAGHSPQLSPAQDNPTQKTSAKTTASQQTLPRKQTASGIASTQTAGTRATNKATAKNSPTGKQPQQALEVLLEYSAEMMGASGKKASDEDMLNISPEAVRNLYYSQRLWLPHPSKGGRSLNTGTYFSSTGDGSTVNRIVDKGLGWGSEMANTMSSQAISTLAQSSRPHLNFAFDQDNYVVGEGDVFWPIFDSKHSTIYTQLGGRNVNDDAEGRWVGNLTMGQRWYPFAQGVGPGDENYDAGDFMLGYNAFSDHDFNQQLQRGGMGAELQYDWLRVDSNYYTPFSGGEACSSGNRAGRDKKHAAKGWDTSLTAYLPFCPYFSFTSSYAQWLGDEVVVGDSKYAKDPSIWSYKLQYAPVQLFSGYVSHHTAPHDEINTEFGLNFTYYFQVPLKEQIKPLASPKRRMVKDGRHMLHRRDNSMVLR